MAKHPLKGLAVVGCGDWGRNHVRTFYQLLGSRLKLVCDTSNERLEKIKKDFPALQTTTDYQQVLTHPDIEAIVIATTAPTHFDLARRALQAGKHVYVEKPMTLRVDDAKELLRLSDEKKLKVMVGHILVYHPAVTKLKELIQKNELGNVYYIYAQRLNLGKVRVDENAMWSFAPHDLAVIFYLFDAELTSIAANGQSFLKEGVEDVVFVNLRFGNGQIANIHLSWLDPHKKRMLTIVGEKKMVVFDDMETQEKLKIYDKGVQFAPDYKSYGEYYQLRFGDILIPKIDVTEPLNVACKAFIRAIEEDAPLLSSARDGLKVVQALKAAQKSLENSGQPVVLSEF